MSHKVLKLSHFAMSSAEEHNDYCVIQKQIHIQYCCSEDNRAHKLEYSSTGSELGL